MANSSKGDITTVEYILVDVLCSAYQLKPLKHWPLQYDWNIVENTEIKYQKSPYLLNIGKRLYKEFEDTRGADRNR